MDAVLLDTDVFSYLIRPGDTRGERYGSHVRAKTVALSFITVGELYVWAEKKGWSGRTLGQFEERLRAAVIVPYDLELCKTYGRVKVSLPVGRVVPPNDLWIAVCAIRHSIPLVTNNPKHYEGIPGLKVITEAGTTKGSPPSPTTRSLFNPPE